MNAEEEEVEDVEEEVGQKSQRDEGVTHTQRTDHNYGGAQATQTFYTPASQEEVGGTFRPWRRSWPSTSPRSSTSPRR